MFDRHSPLLPSPLPWAGLGPGRKAPGVRLLLALAVALSASAVIGAGSAGPVSAAGGADVTGPSIQYQEALTYASKHYTFAVGTPATVPFRPRPGDRDQVDGAAPIALPAAGGSAGDSGIQPSLNPSASSSLLRREVFGFLPYWELGSTLNYDTLSTVAYFGVDLRLDGTLNTSSNGWNGWASATMTSVINNAHAHGTRVALTIQSFAWDGAGQSAQSTILSNPSISLNAAQQIAAEVGRRGVDGVNLDFEPIASGQFSNYVTFVRTLRAELDKVHPGYELTFCANGAPGTYDLPNLLAAGAADAVFIMAYNLRGGSPARTGSIDPLESPFIRYDLNYVTNTFLSQVPPSKILLGLPWYGEAWSTGPTNALNAPPADIPTYGAPANPYYSKAKAIADQVSPDVQCSAGPPATCTGWQYDTGEQTAWTAYFGNFGGTQNTWRELYFDNAQSLGAKCDAIDAWNLRGLGIWALGYDNNNGNGDLTAEIATKFLGVPATYLPITPTRLLDSRYGVGLGGPFSSRVARTFQVTGGVVPAAATAVTGNLTVTAQTSSGYLYIGPYPTNNPTTSTINFPKGDDRANSVTVALGNGGTLSVTYVAPTSGPTAFVIFDVTGYFLPDTSGATYVPLNPTRLLDTRYGTGGSWAPLSSHVARAFAVAGPAGGNVVPTGATAVTGNVTVTQQSSPGYLYVGPVATNDPSSSTLNFPLGDTRANGTTVALNADGTLSVTFVGSNAASTAQVIFDVTGYFTGDGSGARYVAMTPARILDTRFGTGGLWSPFASHAARAFGVAGSSGVPADASAVTGNVTVTSQSSLGFLYVGPVATSNPTSSTINFPVGDDRANSVTVALSGGTLSATYVAGKPSDTTQVIFDVTGYFVP